MSALRFCRNIRFCGLFSMKIFDDPDEVTTSSKTVESIIQDKTNERTGWDRLYYMFSIDEFGVPSPELHIVYQSGFYGAFLGACIGGFIHSRNAYTNFVDSNQATIFKTHLDAKKKLQDQVSISFAKGAFKWGWRVGLFTSTYMLVTTALSTYRGKSSILEYIVAGCATGALYRANLGLRGMLAGGIVGTCLGLAAGSCSFAIFQLTGSSMDNVRFWHHKWKEERVGRMQAMFKAYDEDSHNELLKGHNRKLGPAGESLDSIDIGTPSTR